MTSNFKPGVNYEISEGVATITFNRPEALNALNPEDYDDFAEALRIIDQRDDVVITLWQATGRMFCAGTNVDKGFPKDPETPREVFLRSVARGNTTLTHSLYTHRKLLVAVLNGPVLAFLGLFDFIYAVPKVYLHVPFSFLGILSEGGTSVTFVRRMGLARANEALILGKKLTAQELLECGFINKIFPAQSDTELHATVRKHILSETQSLDRTALLGIKQQIKFGLNEQNSFDAVNLRESFAQADTIASGLPAKRFGMIAKKQLKHKL
ncbi:ClpP/crotonase [Trametopsis cervina]|nr:ClpP/crotonase [Trametopsis cervina]